MVKGTRSWKRYWTSFRKRAGDSGACCRRWPRARSEYGQERRDHGGWANGHDREHPPGGGSLLSRVREQAVRPRRSPALLSGVSSPPSFTVPVAVSTPERSRRPRTPTPRAAAKSIVFNDDLETKQALSALESLVGGRRRPLVVWLGAGASKWTGYPLWEDLADQMHGRFAREVGKYATETASSLLAEGAYPKVFEEMRKSDSALYFSLLTESFAFRQPTPVYQRMLHALRGIRPTYILTTNVDESLERHLPGPETVQRSDVERLPQLLGQRRAFICKLHGSISAVETLVFSARDYDAVQDDIRFVNALHSIFAECSVLFLGYGLRDEHVIEALGRGGSTHPLFGTGPHFMVMPEGSLRAPEGREAHQLSGRSDRPSKRAHEP